METFNRGDVQQFEVDMKHFAQQIDSHKVLSHHKRVLEDKIKIAAFTELVFSLPKNARDISFEQIAHVTKINENVIELMILKAMSLDLLKGSIDEVNL